MCGIAGIVSLTGNRVDPGVVKTMLREIKHRGPDGEGIFVTDNTCIGNVRLKIIDLSDAGHQPMFSHDGRYCIIFNGEIYNYLELKNELRLQYPFSSSSDTEVLLAAFSVWGEKCLHRLNGDFSFVIYDTKEQHLFGARDRFGIKPFYYHLTSKHFFFASEVKALLPIMVRTEPNPKSIFEYLVYNRTDQSEETFFNGILKLKHGHFFTIKNNSFEIKRWYNLADQISAPAYISPEEYREELKKSLRLRLRSEVPIGVSLSGGIDSSSLTSILYHDLNQKQLKTFSAVFRKGSPEDERTYIREFRGLIPHMYEVQPNARSFFKEFEEFIVSHSEPVPGVSPYAQYKVMQLAKGKVVVTLDGQGADEMLGGYTYFYGSYFKELLRSFRLLRLVRESRSYYQKQGSMDGFLYLAYYLLPAGLKNYATQKSSGTLTRDFYKQNQKQSTLAKLLYTTGSLNEFFLRHFEYKLEHLLKWDDLNSMCFSIESRTPFLDHHLVEKTLSIPSSQIIKNGVSKFILRESVKDILPASIYNRYDKKAFEIPSYEWFRTPQFQSYLKDMLSSTSFKQRGYFNVKMCTERYERHLKGKEDWSKEIWKWINLEVWFRQFIDNKKQMTGERALITNELSDHTVTSR
jgi:asparagine synthase (glutamine-hydrolysing)